MNEDKLMVKQHTPGGHSPKRSDDEKKKYSKASPEEKQRMNREHLRRERADCQRSDCDNDATEFESQGVLGWCLGHFFGGNDD